jgi:hypothetical protein
MDTIVIATLDMPSILEELSHSLPEHRCRLCLLRRREPAIPVNQATASLVTRVVILVSFCVPHHA